VVISGICKLGACTDTAAVENKARHVLPVSLILGSTYNDRAIKKNTLKENGRFDDSFLQ